jgi:cytochrome c-type biogenesis protein
MGLEVSIGAAFLAGLLSFLSPCVLPLVPPYLCYMTGYSLDDLAEGSEGQAGKARAVAAAAVLFVAGFSAVFITMGVTASAVGQVLREHMGLLGKIAGVVIILMGLHFLGLLRIGVLYRQAQFQPQMKQAGLVGAFVIGLAFGFGWTPCIGPILAVILAVAASSESVAQGTALLAIYSAGLGVPFIAAAVFLGRFLSFFRRFRQHLAAVERAMGLFLVATGVMFLTGSIQTLSYWFLEMFPGLATLG